MSVRQPTAQPLPRHERPFRVLRYRDFRLIWSAEVLSQTGTQIQRVAVAWQVFELTGNPFHLGPLGLVRFVPLFLFGLAGGVVADRYDRRQILIISQLALMAVASAFAGLTATGGITLVWIYGLTALSALFGAVAAPTRHALIPTLVPRASIPSAMSMGVLAFQSAGMAGPAIGGVLVASVGIAPSYAVDALSFGLVAISAFALHSRPVRAAPIISGRAAANGGFAVLAGITGAAGNDVPGFPGEFFRGKRHAHADLRVRGLRRRTTNARLAADGAGRRRRCRRHDHG
jgi:MFS family permease